MPPLICPDCSRPNTDDASQCRYCGHKFHPERPDAGQGRVEPVDNTLNNSEEVPEWLRNIRERHRRETGPAPEPPPSNLDEVINRLRGRGASADRELMDETQNGEITTGGGEPATAEVFRGEAQPEEVPEAAGNEAGMDETQLTRPDTGAAAAATSQAEAATELPGQGIEPLPEFGSDGAISTGGQEPVIENTSPAMESRPEEAEPFVDSGAGLVQGELFAAGEVTAPQHPADPLGAIQGLLPGQEFNYTTGSPSTQEARQNRPGGALFEHTLLAEKEYRAAPVYRRNNVSFLVRWVIAGLLIAAISLVFIAGQPAENLPQNIPLETVQMLESLQELPQNPLVLLILDYDAAYAGEIEAAAATPLEILTAKDARVFAISTSPHNLFLAQKLLDTLAKGKGADDGAEIKLFDMTTLGYLPGGQAGMQNLLRDFNASIPLSLNLTRTAGLDGLGENIRLNDFAGVMLLTDNPDSARHWVEQVQPSLDGPAIWMAVSSQAVVPLRPYLRSGQVDGLNGGIYGSVSLDQVANTNGPATKLWNAYTAGLIVALLIMLAGGLMNYFGFSLIRSRKGGRQ